MELHDSQFREIKLKFLVQSQGPHSATSHAPLGGKESFQILPLGPLGLRVLQSLSAYMVLTLLLLDHIDVGVNVSKYALGLLSP